MEASSTLTGERDETVVTTGYEYGPGDPVRVRIVRRWHRTSVSDGGAALERAGDRDGRGAVASRLERELGVNVSRQGVVSLPVVRVGPPEPEVVRRIAEASLSLYQELLELTE